MHQGRISAGHAAAQQAQVERQRGQRLAQVVAGRRQKPRLGVVGALSLLLGAFELGAAAQVVGQVDDDKQKATDRLGVGVVQRHGQHLGRKFETVVAQRLPVPHIVERPHRGVERHGHQAGKADRAMLTLGQMMFSRPLSQAGRRKHAQHRRLTNHVGCQVAQHGLRTAVEMGHDALRRGGKDGVDRGVQHGLL